MSESTGPPSVSPWARAGRGVLGASLATVGGLAAVVLVGMVSWSAARGYSGAVLGAGRPGCNACLGFLFRPARGRRISLRLRWSEADVPRDPSGLVARHGGPPNARDPATAGIGERRAGFLAGRRIHCFSYSCYSG